MNTITTHVLDVTRGKPASGLAIVLERSGPAGWIELGRGETDPDGRLRTLLGDRPLETGSYRLRFATGAWHQSLGIDGFYPEVTLEFHVRDASQHYHVPLLLSPFGYSTYRGS